MISPSGSEHPSDSVTVPGGNVATGKLTFRTVFGGPSPQPGYLEEVARIKQRLREVAFSYDFDLFLTIGGDITPVDGPSGLRAPRVSLARRTVTGQIQVSRADTIDASDPLAFLRQTIHSAITELMGRVATRDAGFDPDEEQRKIAFLTEEEPDASTHIP